MFLLSKLKNNTLVLWHIVFVLLQTLSSFSTYAENVLTKARHINALKGITNARQSKKKLRTMGKVIYFWTAPHVCF